MRILHSPVFIAIAAVVLGMPCAPAGAADGLSFDLELEVVSAYVFRGMVLNPDPALQPALAVSAGSLSLTGWASVNLTDVLGSAGEVGELDLVLGYGFDLGPVTGSLGLAHYRYWTPDEGHTTELVLEAAVDAPVEPRLLLAYDVDAADGLYARLAVGRPVVIAEKLDLDLEAGLAWASAGVNAYNLEVERAALADGSLSATLEGPLAGGAWWLRIAWSWMWERDLENGALEIYGDAEVLSATLGFAWSLPAVPE